MNINILSIIFHRINRHLFGQQILFQVYHWKHYLLFKKNQGIGENSIFVYSEIINSIDSKYWNINGFEVTPILKHWWLTKSIAFIEVLMDFKTFMTLQESINHFKELYFLLATNGFFAARTITLNWSQTMLVQDIIFSGHLNNCK